MSYKEIFEYFGYKKQRRKLQEEVDEFKDEVLLWENGKSDIKNVTLELADILNVLQGFIEEYEISDKEIKEAQLFKKNRTNERIKSGYYKQLIDKEDLNE